MFAFMFAVIAAIATSVETVQADDLAIQGRWKSACDEVSVECGSGNFTCMVGSEVIYEDNEAQACVTPLRQILPN